MNPACSQTDKPSAISKDTVHQWATRTPPAEVQHQNSLSAHTEYKNRQKRLKRCQKETFRTWTSLTHLVSPSLTVTASGDRRRKWGIPHNWQSGVMPSNWDSHSCTKVWGLRFILAKQRSALSLTVMECCYRTSGLTFKPLNFIPETLAWVGSVMQDMSAPYVS